MHQAPKFQRTAFKVWAIVQVPQVTWTIDDGYGQTLLVPATYWAILTRTFRESSRSLSDSTQGNAIPAAPSPCALVHKIQTHRKSRRVNLPASKKIGIFHLMTENEPRSYPSAPQDTLLVLQGDGNIMLQNKRPRHPSAPLPIPPLK